MTAMQRWACIWLTACLVVQVLGAVARGAQVQQDGIGEDGPSNACLSLALHLLATALLAVGLGVVAFSRV